MAESIHEKLKRVRKPRVHITYQVETEGAAVVRELPFVVGVMGDFSGDPTEPLKSLKDRKFIQIDRDNFNDVMGRMTPGLNLKVKNTLKDDGSELGVQLKFGNMDDFSPEKVAQQVEPVLGQRDAHGHRQVARTTAQVVRRQLSGVRRAAPLHGPHSPPPHGRQTVDRIQRADQNGGG